MAQDFKTPITVNSILVSLEGHRHNFATLDILVCKALKSTTQTYLANVNTKVTVDSLMFNTGFNVDMANERLVFPSSIQGQGIFEIRTNIDLNSTSTMYIYVYKNGILFETPYYCSVALNTHMCATLLQFAPNDYIEIWIKGATARTIQTTSTLSIKQVA